MENQLPDSVISGRLNKQAAFLKGYKQRTDSIISMCLSAGIQPIFMTQPSLFGDYKDPVTGVNMKNKWINQKDADNSLLQEKILEKYNDVLRADSSRIKLIDLAALMPKNSLYYYDFIHFTNQGAEKVAEILANELQATIRIPGQ